MEKGETFMAEQKISRRSFLAACGLLGAGALTGCRSESTAAAAEEPLQLVFFNMDGISDSWTDPVAQKITEKTGITLKTLYPSRGSSEAIDLMLTDGEYPDLIFAKGDVNKLVEADALVDMEPLIEEYGPNIKTLYGADYRRLRYSAEKPHIYQLCSNTVNKEIYTTSGSAQLQWAVLKEHNYQIPYTLADYEAQIKAYLAAHPETDGKPTIGISLCCTDWRWYITLSNPSAAIAEAAPDNGQWLINEEAVTYLHAGPNQKEYYAWLNRMYWEGVLDPEFATQTFDDYKQKIVSGRVLGLLDADWNFAEAQKELIRSDKTAYSYAGLPVTLHEDDVCPSLYNWGLSPGWGVGITTACQHPERAMKFLDWLCSEEGQVLIHWGIERENYTVDANGRRVRSQEEIDRSRQDTDYQSETGVGFHAYPFPGYGKGVYDSTGNSYQIEDKDYVISSYNAEEKAACKAWGVEMLRDIFPPSESFPAPTHSAGWNLPMTRELAAEVEQLNNTAWQGLIDCILIPQDEFDSCWEKLQQNLLNAGRLDAEQQMAELVKKQKQFWETL